MPAGQPKALVPQDIRGVRQQQIGYLQDPQSFLKLLGGLGSPQSPLQMQGGDALGQMLRQPCIHRRVGCCTRREGPWPLRDRRRVQRKRHAEGQ